MKKHSAILVIASMILLSCTGPAKIDYLYLSPSQLKQIGISVSEQGVFFKNHNPKAKEMDEKYPWFGLYSTNDVYLNTILYRERDTLHPESKTDSLFVMMKATEFDFYPILIGNSKGIYSFKKSDITEKLFPVAIKMSDLNIPRRKDTLVIWFKPTASLQKLFGNTLRVEDYLAVPPFEKQKPQ
jgi:hypothetical protein